jgi:ABC-type antimicrobial peptide transport system permease subunit
MGESMMLVAIGVGVGLAAAIAASRLVTTLLFGLAPTDGLTMVTAMMALVGVSAVAGYLPARRAAKVDPLVALHYE